LIISAVGNESEIINTQDGYRKTATYLLVAGYNCLRSGSELIRGGHTEISAAADIAG